MNNTFDKKKNTKDSDHAHRLSLLHKIKGSLSPEDVEYFDKFRSSLLAFRENSYERNKEFIIKILSFNDSLQRLLREFFKSIELDVPYQVVLQKGKDDRKIINSITLKDKSYIPSILKDFSVFPLFNLSFISETFKGINHNRAIKNIQAFICTFDLNNICSKDIASTIKNTCAYWSHSPEHIEHACIITLTTDDEVFIKGFKLLDEAIHKFRQGRNYTKEFNNIYFLLHTNKGLQYFTLDDYCEKDGFKKRNIEKSNKRLSRLGITNIR